MNNHYTDNCITKQGKIIIKNHITTIHQTIVIEFQEYLEFQERYSVLSAPLGGIRLRDQ